MAERKLMWERNGSWEHMHFETGSILLHERRRPCCMSFLDDKKVAAVVFDDGNGLIGSITVAPIETYDSYLSLFFAGGKIARLYGIEDHPGRYWFRQGKPLPADEKEPCDLYRAIAREEAAKVKKQLERQQEIERPRKIWEKLKREAEERARQKAEEERKQKEQEIRDIYNFPIISGICLFPTIMTARAAKRGAFADWLAWLAIVPCVLLGVAIRYGIYWCGLIVTFTTRFDRPLLSSRGSSIQGHSRKRQADARDCRPHAHVQRDARRNIHP